MPRAVDLTRSRPELQKSRCHWLQSSPSNRKYMFEKDLLIRSVGSAGAPFSEQNVAAHFHAWILKKL